MTKQPFSASMPNADVKRPVVVFVIIYLVVIVLLELLGYFTSVLISAIGNALLIFIAVNHSASAKETALHHILPSLALIPFVRLLTIVIPVPGWPPQIIYILIAVPLLITAGIIVHNGDISSTVLGLRHWSWRTQLLIGLSGVPLGYMGFMILRPDPLFEAPSPVMLVVNLVVIFIFIALSEEIIFRGMFLHAIRQIGDNFAILASAVLYGVYHIGSGSIVYALYMGVVGWLYAYFAVRTRSLWGVIIGHFFLTAGMGLFWPGLF